MTRCIAVAIVMPLLAVFMFCQEPKYVDDQNALLKIHHEGIDAVA